MNKDKLLQATGPELSKLLGEILLYVPKGYGDPDSDIYANMSKEFRGKHVSITSAVLEVENNYLQRKNGGIPLTPDNAFKWRDWAVEKYGESKFVQVLYDMIRNELGYGFLEIIAFAQPEHYLKAVALCVLGDKT